MDQTSENLDLLAGISHEIRNPLHAIIGISNLMKAENSPEEQEELIATLKQSSENLLEITNNILDFTKLESGNVHYDYFPVDLRKSIPRALFGQRALAKSKGISLSIEIDRNVPATILVDKVKFLQVLINLVSNAVKFTERGRVEVRIEEVSTTTTQTTLKCAVVDTGMGIPKEKIVTIFEPFTQASGDVNLKYGGTGLGLTISKRLVEAMGGEMDVASEEGKGTEFSFTMVFDLPRENNPTCEEAEDITADQLPPNLKVLVVEDNSINLMVAQKLLESWGMKYALARNGEEALRKVQEQEFDVIFMDLQMPKMNGFDATYAIRHLDDEKFLKLPIIALSGSTGIQHQDEIKASGFNHFLTKPYKPQDLIKAIYDVLQGR